jgi:hypothetical protein
MKPGQGIPEMTLGVLQRIERLLEKGVGFEPVLPPIVANGEAEVLTVEEDLGRYGYFSSVWGPGTRPSLTLRWHPGTEGLFPTLDQMAEAKSLWPKAEAWDFSVLGADAHYFGIPLEFGTAC